MSMGRIHVGVRNGQGEADQIHRHGGWVLEPGRSRPLLMTVQQCIVYRQDIEAADWDKGLSSNTASQSVVILAGQVMGI